MLSDHKLQSSLLVIQVFGLWLSSDDRAIRVPPRSHPSYSGSASMWGGAASNRVRERSHILARPEHGLSLSTT
jgi:hypothetical protein